MSTILRIRCLPIKPVSPIFCKIGGSDSLNEQTDRTYFHTPLFSSCQLALAFMLALGNVGKYICFGGFNVEKGNSWNLEGKLCFSSFKKKKSEKCSMQMYLAHLMKYYVCRTTLFRCSSQVFTYIYLYCLSVFFHLFLKACGEFGALLQESLGKDFSKPWTGGTSFAGFKHLEAEFFHAT